jgi:hypothetical protein
MALYKSAQVMDIDDEISKLVGDDEVILYDEKPTEKDVVEMHQPETVEISFKLPNLPGCEDELPLEVSTDDPVEVEEKEDKKSKKDKNDGPPMTMEEVEAKDPFDWQSLGVEHFIEWLHRRLQTIPRHHGEMLGMERAVAYLKRLLSECSKAVSSDLHSKIDIAQLEPARNEILNGIERLEDACDAHHKKRSERRDLLVKEAQKATHVGGIIVTVPIFISRLAKICINGTVSAGHDTSDLFDRLVKKFALTNVQQHELMELLANMGYPIQRDRAYNVNELMDITSTDNYDYSAHYAS